MQPLYSSLLFMILLILTMYLLLIRPQKKREKRINAMRSNIKVGDNIITIGGIYGTVTKVKDDSLTIQVGADKTKIEITRWAVSQVEESSPSGTSKTKPDAAEQEPVKKAPRRRLEKAEPAVENPENPEGSIAENILEADSEKNPSEEQ